jgi:hypothetical protein
MGFPEIVVARMLQQQLRDRPTWSAEQRLQNVLRSLLADDVQRLVRMGFPEIVVARMLQQQLRDLPTYPEEERLQNVLSNLLNERLVGRLDELNGNPLIVEDVPYDHNCCFHALLHALRHLQQSPGGHNFNGRSLPLDHAGMREAIVDYARANLYTNDLFLNDLFWLNPLSSHIGGSDPQIYLDVRTCSALCFAT